MLSLGDGGSRLSPPRCRRKAESLLTGWLADRHALDAETAHALALAAPQRAGEPLWQAMLNATRRETDRVRRGLLFVALGQFRDAALAERAWACCSVRTSLIRETLPILGRLAMFLRRASWSAFVQKNFDALVARLPATVVLAWRG